MQTHPERSLDRLTLNQFSALLPQVVRGSIPTILSLEETIAAWDSGPLVTGRRKTRVSWDSENQRLIIFLFPRGDTDSVPVAAVATHPLVAPDDLELQFLDRLVRVFNDDVRHAPSMKVDDELWSSLRQTQFRRAIMKFSAFKKFGMLEWLQTLETSTRLRYEGHAFALSILMTYHLEYVVDNLSTEYVPFNRSLSFSEALLGEKWIRAVTQSERVGLVGLSSGKIVGFFVIPQPNDIPDERWRFAPHFHLRGVQQLVREGTCAFVTSPAGDVRVMLPNGTTFLNSQGRWQYTRFESVIPILTRHLSEEMAVAVLRAALDLSFERHGALLCIVGDPDLLPAMIPDFNEPKTNRVLRQSVRGLSLLSWHQREVMVSAAGTDGAVVLDASGIVYDAGCIIADPAIERVHKLGFERPHRGSGARETAAWNASLYGLSVKVSADGPIQFFLNGNVIAGLG
jgi:hypothetical protein